MAHRLVAEGVIVDLSSSYVAAVSDLRAVERAAELGLDGLEVFAAREPHGLAKVRPIAARPSRQMVQQVDQDLLRLCDQSGS